MPRKKYRDSHIAQGLCSECKEHVIPGYGYCGKHLLKQREYKHKYYILHRESELDKLRKYRTQAKESGRCPTCGRPNDGPTVKCGICMDWRHGLRTHGSYRYGTLTEDSTCQP